MSFWQSPVGSGVFFRFWCFLFSKKKNDVLNKKFCGKVIVKENPIKFWSRKKGKGWLTTSASCRWNPFQLWDPPCGRELSSISPGASRRKTTHPTRWRRQPKLTPLPKGGNAGHGSPLQHTQNSSRLTEMNSWRSGFSLHSNISYEVSIPRAVQFCSLTTVLSLKSFHVWGRKYLIRNHKD